MSALFPESFYRRDALAVAADLLGAEIARDGLVLTLTEVEAYRPGDTASHCRAGPTPRNQPMWGPPGRLYVYRCYGLHDLLNLVTGPAGSGQAVLVRAAEIAVGEDLARARGVRPDPRGIVGPGLVGRALGVDPAWSHHPVFEPGGITVGAGRPVAGFLSGPRIGVDYADPADRDAPWRLAAAGTRAVARPRALRAGLPDPRWPGWRGSTSS
jgi:DNA-3-methyladenine glycosylase